MSDEINCDYKYHKDLSQRCPLFSESLDEIRYIPMRDFCPGEKDGCDFAEAIQARQNIINGAEITRQDEVTRSSLAGFILPLS